jgi:RNA polymerase sigma-54 factor
MTKMLITTKLDQRVSMNQQLQQAITLLQYNTLDLKQLVQQFIETNPLIDVEESEAVDNDNASLISNDAQDESHLTKYSADFIKSRQYHHNQDDNALENYSSPKSLREYMLEQTLLCKFTVSQQIVAESLIDAVDDNGRLNLTLEDIQQSITEPCQPEMGMVEEVLQRIQTFDPAGVGARNVRESLLIQLGFLNADDNVWLLANNIITYCYDLFTVNNSKKIMKRLNVSQEQYSEAMVLIRSLNPNPGRAYSGDPDINVEPELYVKKIKNTWHVFLAESILTHVKINRQYQDLIKQSKQHGSYEALNRELQEAQWLMKGLQRRNETLVKVAICIVEFQKDFLENGHAFMKPLNIVDVSHHVNLHESTVSRVTTGKYISTPRGVFELKYFFPSHVSTQGGIDCSDTAVKSLIKEIISQEKAGHAHSDSEIAAILKERGTKIARRTVAKYREAIQILPSYQRVQMQIS